MSDHFLANTFFSGGERAADLWRQRVISRQEIAAIGLKYQDGILKLVQIEGGNFPLDRLEGLRPLSFEHWFDSQSQWRLQMQTQESMRYGLPLNQVLKLAIEEPTYWELRAQIVYGGKESEVENDDVHFEGVLIDVTATHLHMQAIEEEKRFIEDLFRLSGTIFCVLDIDGRIVRHNQSFSMLLGNLSVEDYKIAYHPKLFSPDQAKSLREWVVNPSRQEGVFDYTMSVTTKSGIGVWLGWRVVIDQEEGEKCLVMTGTDITKQVLLQRELESANQNLLIRNDEIKEITHKQKKLFTLLEQFRGASDSMGVFSLMNVGLRELIDFRNLFFFVKSSDKHQSYEVFDALSDFKDTERRIYFEEFKGVLGRVLTEHVQYYSGQVKQDKEYVMHHPDVNSLAMVPILSRGTLLGVLGADSERFDAFSDVELEMLKLCAEHLGLYLDELQLRHALQQQSFQLKDLHGIVTRMMQGGDRQSSAEILTHEALFSHIGVYAFIENELKLISESQPHAIDKFDQPHAFALVEQCFNTNSPQHVRIRSQQLFHSCVPIALEQDVFGVLYRVHNEDLNDHDAELMAIVSNQLAMIWRLEDLMGAIKEEALVDPLTELRNRRYIMRRIQEEQQRMDRYGGCASIVMIDLTDFKYINDAYGHLVGDEVLKLVAKTLQSCIRESDEIGRFGGDEFVMLLPNTSYQAAQDLVKRMQETLRNTQMTDLDIRVQGDFGIVTIPDQALDVMSALKIADNKMYSHKRRIKKQE